MQMNIAHVSPKLSPPSQFGEIPQEKLTKRDLRYCLVKDGVTGESSIITDYMQQYDTYRLNPVTINDGSALVDFERYQDIGSHDLGRHYSLSHDKPIYDTTQPLPRGSFSISA
jgi:hypothetical protein